MKNHCQKNKQDKGKGEEEEQQEPKTVIITGGNSGLGFECAKSFLQGHWGSNWHVVLVCRDQTRALQAVQALKRATHADASVEEMACDLGSLASIRSFVENFGQRREGLPPLRAAVLNAGLQIVSKTTFTEDGFEATFGVNHLGHFLMAHLLLRHMKAPARLVFVSSGTHDPKQRTGLPDPVYHTARELAFPKKEDEEGKSPSEIGQLRYATSKLCNVLCAYEFARRLSAAASPGEPHVAGGSSSQKQEPSVRSDISVTAFDPGLMPGTGLARDYGGLLRFAWHNILPAAARLFYRNVHTPEASGKALARLAASPELEGVTAKYFEGLREIPSSDDSYDEEKARDLWETSIELVGLQKEETLITLS